MRKFIFEYTDEESKNKIIIKLKVKQHNDYPYLVCEAISRPVDGVEILNDTALKFDELPDIQDNEYYKIKQVVQQYGNVQNQYNTVLDEGVYQDLITQCFE